MEAESSDNIHKHNPTSEESTFDSTMQDMKEFG